MARHQRCRHSQIGCRLCDLHAADDVDISIINAKVQSEATLQNRQQHIHAVIIKAYGCTPWHAVGSFRNERLELHHNRPVALHAGTNHAAADGALPAFQKKSGRIGNLLQAAGLHGENAALVRAAEAVLERTQHAEGVGAVALELQHHVHHMLQKTWSGNRAILRHVADDHDRNARGLGELQKLCRTLAHLAHAAGRRLQLRIIHRLDTVDDEQLRLDIVRLRQNSVQIRSRHNQQPVARVRSAKADRTHRCLLLAFLAADIEHLDISLGKAQACVQQDCRLADARRTA